MEMERASVPQSRCGAPYSPRLVGYRELSARDRELALLGASELGALRRADCRQKAKPSVKSSTHPREVGDLGMRNAFGDLLARG